MSTVAARLEQAHNRDIDPADIEARSRGFAGVEADIEQRVPEAQRDTVREAYLRVDPSQREALETLAKLNPRHARVVELRFFAGLTVPEVAELLDVSGSTIAVDWRVARAWLNQCLCENGESHDDA